MCSIGRIFLLYQMPLPLVKILLVTYQLNSFDQAVLLCSKIWWWSPSSTEPECIIFYFFFYYSAIKRRKVWVMFNVLSFVIKTVIQCSILCQVNWWLLELCKLILLIGLTFNVLLLLWLHLTFEVGLEKYLNVVIRSRWNYIWLIVFKLKILAKSVDGLQFNPCVG